MGLIIGDRIEGSLERARWRAKDSVTGTLVMVSISHEALKDQGEEACLLKAEEKYDGSEEPVDITTGDF